MQLPPSMSTPAMSTPADSSINVHSCNVHPRFFHAPSMSTPAISVNPTRVKRVGLMLHGCSRPTASLARGLHDIYASIIRPRRSRSAAAYRPSRQTFPWTICWSVRTSVRPSVGGSVCTVLCGKMADRIRMPFGIIGRTMRQVVGFEDRSTVRGIFGANLGRAIVTKGDFTAYRLRVRQRREADLFPNYFGQTCYHSLHVSPELLQWSFQ